MKIMLFESRSEHTEIHRPIHTWREDTNGRQGNAISYLFCGESERQVGVPKTPGEMKGWQENKTWYEPVKELAAVPGGETRPCGLRGRWRQKTNRPSVRRSVAF